MTRLGPVAVALVGAVLMGAAGCSPGAEQTEPSPTPTPQWTEEEQELIDAVDEYLRVSSEIGQNPVDTGEWDRIYDVAGEPAAGASIDRWLRWLDNGWHEVGTPSFEPGYIVPGMSDHQGKRFNVLGCYNATYIVDAHGDRPFPDTLEQVANSFRVLRLEEGGYLVLDNTTKGEPCAED
jgi:hypothetical protein